MPDLVRNYVVDGLDKLPGVSAVLGCRARRKTWRSYAVAEPSSSAPITFSSPQHCPCQARPVVMVFFRTRTTQSGTRAVQTYPVFRQSVLETDEVFRKNTDKSTVLRLANFHSEFQMTREVGERNIGGVSVTCQWFVGWSTHLCSLEYLFVEDDVL
ncbi:hypothetical protein BKA93DRAFT_94022 [Sparassis latifolia]